MIGHHVFVNFANRTFLSANTPGENSGSDRLPAVRLLTSVSRIALPLFHVSAIASISRLASIRVSDFQ